MEIQTTRFGTIEFPEDLVITVTGGLLGFPQAERFAVLDHDREDSPFKWFQAVDDPNLAFIIVDPHQLMPDYLSLIKSDVKDAIGAFEAEDISTITIVTVPQDNPIEMTANLRAPVVVKFSTRVGRQVILTDEKNSLNHRIFPDPPQQNPQEISAATH